MNQINCEDCKNYANRLLENGDIKADEIDRLMLDRHILKGCDKKTPVGNKDLVILMCPPYPEYKTPPEDQSHSELFDCPKCNEKMWLSEKKKGVIMFASCLDKEILLACYSCIKKIVEADPSLILESNKVDL